MLVDIYFLRKYLPEKERFCRIVNWCIWEWKTIIKDLWKVITAASNVKNETVERISDWKSCESYRMSRRPYWHVNHKIMIYSCVCCCGLFLVLFINENQYPTFLHNKTLQQVINIFHEDRYYKLNLTWYFAHLNMKLS